MIGAALRHRAKLVKDEHRRGVDFHGECSCGWKSDAVRLTVVDDQRTRSRAAATVVRAIKAHERAQGIT